MINKMEINKSSEQYLHIDNNQLTINVKDNINTNIYKIYKINKKISR